MENAITVFTLLIPYFAIAWVLIGVSLLVVRYLSSSKPINTRPTITARPNHYSNYRRAA